MKQLGFKNLLLISIIMLVGLSVSITSYVSYINEEKVLTDLVMKQNSDYVKQQAKLIESQLNGKAIGLARVANLYDNLGPEGSTEKFVKLADTIAFSMDLNSSVVAFENGDGYWNQLGDNWPEYKFKGDITGESYYQLARRTQSSATTEPYGTTDYWISIVHQIKNGMISVDMKLDFLNNLVKDTAQTPGRIAMILNHDSTVLASSSKVVASKKLASSYPWFEQAILATISTESNVQPYQLNGVDKLLFSHRIQVADKFWYYTLGLDTDVAYASLYEAQKEILISTVIAIVVSVALAYMLLQMLYRPILALKQTITETEVETFEINKLIGNLTEAYQLNSSNIYFKPSTEAIHMKGSQELLAQILDKLVQNAIDYIISNQ